MGWIAWTISTTALFLVGACFPPAGNGSRGARRSVCILVHRRTLIAKTLRQRCVCATKRAVIVVQCEEPDLAPAKVRLEAE